MFITRASRHDVKALEELLAPAGVPAPNPRDGTTLIARSGKLVGCVRLKEVAPEAVAIDKLYVTEDGRGQGVGRRLLEAAMSHKGGALYVCCHADDREVFAPLGFSDIAPDALPVPVMDHFVEAGDYPAPEGHPEHVFLVARANPG